VVLLEAAAAYLQGGLEDHFTVHTGLDCIKELHAWRKCQAEVQEEGQHVAANISRRLGGGPLPPKAARTSRACAEGLVR